MASAIVIGSSGQDGRILTRQLRSDGISTVGVTTPRHEPGPDERIVDLDSPAAVSELIAEVQPEQLYYLAGYHHASESVPEGDAEIYARSEAVHVRGLINVLDAARLSKLPVRVFYAGSSHQFGFPQLAPQDEETPMRPVSIYGITKLAGMLLCNLYRTLGVFCSCGILYTHESPLRDATFVSQRIIRGARAVIEGKSYRIVVGDLKAAIDWGWAEDAVAAMRKLLDHSTPDDFIIATGESHTVGEFAEIVCRLAGLDPLRHLLEDPALNRRQPARLIGDASRLRRATGWAPSVSFAEMVELLWKAELRK